MIPVASCQIQAKSATLHQVYEHGHGPDIREDTPELLAMFGPAMTDTPFVMGSSLIPFTYFYLHFHTVS
jgi:hypothetical protein